MGAESMGALGAQILWQRGYSYSEHNAVLIFKIMHCAHMIIIIRFVVVAMYSILALLM